MNVQPQQHAYARDRSALVTSRSTDTHKKNRAYHAQCSPRIAAVFFVGDGLDVTDRLPRGHPHLHMLTAGQWAAARPSYRHPSDPPWAARDSR